jgi:N-acetylglutamate synthase-like GNAT family acetyltransferase
MTSGGNDPIVVACRRAAADDAPALVQLIRSAYRGQASQAGWTSEADLVQGDRTDIDSVLSLIARARSEMLVVEEQGSLLACCQLEDRGGGAAYFGTFAVDPQRQGGGLGRWLMAQAEREAVQQFGAHTVEITVLAQQETLIAWYERLGFTRTGETRPFPADPDYARPLRRGLHFVVLAKSLAALPDHARSSGRGSRARQS